jgi:hypothetical protein
MFFARSAKRIIIFVGLRGYGDTRSGGYFFFLRKRTCCAPSVCAWEAAQADYGGSSSSNEGSHELYCVGEAKEGRGQNPFMHQNVRTFVRTKLSLSIVTTEVTESAG